MVEMPPSTAETIQLAELLAVLSLGADLGMGQPMEHAMRQCVLALRIGQRLELSDDDQAVLYYLSLIAWVGCHIDAYEQAKWFGDDLALKANFRQVDPVGVKAIGSFLSQLGAGRHGMDRAGLVLRFLASGTKDANAMLANHWYAADQLAGDLGLSQEVRGGLLQTFERWDGKGAPNGSKGEEIQITARIVNLADVLEVFHHAGGVKAAVDTARQRSGTQFDPSLVELVAADATSLFTNLDKDVTWSSVIEAEPVLGVALTVDELDSALEAIGDFIDLKSPYTLGHTRSVANLAKASATVMGWTATRVTHIWRAALLHDLGRLGVSNAIWDKPGPLTAGEIERIRLHPYLTERMLASSPHLCVFGSTAAQHHERMDGSGYPRGLAGDAMSDDAKLLAAVDAYAGKLEPRPYRPALAAAEAAQTLRDEVRAGRQDAFCVEAILKAAGHPVRRRHEWPAGLTTREVEVLRLVARGLSNKQIAERLVIARKTVDNHVEHIYSKAAVSNRARASLFAVRHGLMSADEDGEFTS